MGNILVSGGILDGSLSGLAVVVGWFSIVILLIVRWIVEEPFGTVQSKNRIRNNEVRRQKRFNDAKLKVEDIGEDLRDEIVGLNFQDLRESLQEGKYNAVTVLKAYAWKALIENDRVNCLAEFLVESFEKAEKLDEQYEYSNEKPALYGIPFSVKGNFFMKGYDCTCGLSKFLENPKEDTCTIVTALEDLGAVPFVLTNVPQALLSFVCSNPVYGTTKNPYNVNRVPGGSSGGEAALLASGGTAFATGSDLAGSLRIPSTMCGLVSIKPTQDRITVRHASQGVPGRGRMALAYGFITKSVDEQIYLIDQVLGLESFHKSCPTAVPMPLKMDIINETANKKLRIGYFSDDGFLKPSTGCERVVVETVEKLKAQGHELVHFRLPRPNHAAEICYKSILTDGGTFLCNLFRGEVIDQYMSSFVSLIKIPLLLRTWAAFVLGFISPQAQILSRSFVRNIEELRQNQEHVDLYQEAIIDQWNELALDAIVCPAFCVPAVEHKWPSLLGACGFATAFWNMINFPSGVVPAGKWNKEDTKALEEYETGNNFVLKFVKQSSAGSEGLPLSVQIATKPYEEEKCLAIMKIVEQLWKE
ncbi:unnamed protein product [Bursaphelenchus okinawaensis]|uniref:Amidase domain-containing protein n=1 Tax=Bursaphelenchus okinawaensis TaxID=465554 RepID=A0A811KVY3_9BILA|nr:unnamed protein product [Bursaphelenchus okinawaensis]CAG9113097.1 unnamed protein product [Bursaphelenchus okinawaensis]